MSLSLTEMMMPGALCPGVTSEVSLVCATLGCRGGGGFSQYAGIWRTGGAQVAPIPTTPKKNNKWDGPSARLDLL